ncbi:hypothetical protein BU679_10340 [Staphylococcus chromogenes]|nr:hypothetical protein BUX97_09990 [Staphylococcus chromogenes]PTG50338.1 hypothetical protein BU679_10340 [Staphylococcus chromogenes]RIM07794.1 hypothetical protein BU680_06330 [Staphylococcus chromogenes]
MTWQMYISLFALSLTLLLFIVRKTHFNNKIKLIKHVAYGYRNFNNFRNRILIISRLYVSEYKKRTKQQKLAT